MSTLTDEVRAELTEWIFTEGELAFTSDRAKAMMARLPALCSEHEALERDIASLRLELTGSEYNRVKGNEELIARCEALERERDEAQIENMRLASNRGPIFRERYEGPNNAQESSNSDEARLTHHAADTEAAYREGYAGGCFDSENEPNSISESKRWLASDARKRTLR